MCYQHLFYLQAEAEEGRHLYLPIQLGLVIAVVDFFPFP